MKKRIKYIQLIGITFLLLLTSCNTTRVVSSWTDDDIPANSLSRILVIGLLRDREARDQIEEIMTRELKKEGVYAATATSLFGPKRFEGLSEEEITEALKGSEFTSIMLVSLLDKEREKSYTPGAYYSTPRIMGYSRFYRRYLLVYDNIYTPGYYTTRTNYVMQADMYSLQNDELIYSAQTKSDDPGSSRSLAEGFTKSIIKELKEKNLIGKTINSYR